MQGHSDLPETSPAVNASACEKEVLLLGRDETLLAYREQVLRQGGFTTAVLHWTGDLDVSLLPNAKVVVLGHTLREDERLQVTTSLYKRFPSAKIIALDAGNMPVEESHRYAAVLENLSGPALLIESVRRQLRRDDDLHA
jgi:hypothetical protein